MRPEGYGGVTPSALLPRLNDVPASQSARCLASGATPPKTRAIRLLPRAARAEAIPSRHGFTLIETMIATGIMVAGLLAVASILHVFRPDEHPQPAADHGDSARQFEARGAKGDVADQQPDRRRRIERSEPYGALLRVRFADDERHLDSRYRDRHGAVPAAMADFRNEPETDHRCRLFPTQWCERPTHGTDSRHRRVSRMAFESMKRTRAQRILPGRADVRDGDHIGHWSDRAPAVSPERADPSGIRTCFSRCSRVRVPSRR